MILSSLKRSINYTRIMIFVRVATTLLHLERAFQLIFQDFVIIQWIEWYRIKFKIQLKKTYSRFNFVSIFSNISNSWNNIRIPNGLGHSWFQQYKLHNTCRNSSSKDVYYPKFTLLYKQDAALANFWCN